MRITACLAFYAEPPAFLARCVRSLAPFCDRIVALDGRWDLFPAVTDWTSEEETKAIECAAYEIGIEVVLGSGTFPSQVAKRDALMQLAAPGSDWLLVIDGDEHLQVDAAAARAALEETTFDVAQVMLEPMNQGWPLRELPANRIPVRRIYRSGVRCPGPSHAHYELDDLHLAGDPNYVDLEPALDLSSLIVLHHDNQNRGSARDDAAKQYRRERARARVEAWA